MMKKLIIFISILFTTFVVEAADKKLNILVTFNPIYSLVRNITGDLDNTQLLINPNYSPHNYQLKPSDVQKIKDADIIFMVDDGFEVFLARYLKKNHIKAKIVKIIESPDLITLPTRKIKVLDVAHDHDHDHHNHGHDHSKCHHNIDLHIWTNPLNAQIIVQDIATTLAKSNPNHKDIYLENSRNTINKLKDLDLEISKTLDKQIQNRPFISFHDAYQYLEQHYHLINAGTIAGHDFVYGPKTIEELKKNVKEHDVKCVFAEPQFSNNLMQKIAKSTGTKLGYLDIEGGNFGKKVKPEELYFFMMRKNVENIKSCLQD
jgi:zinc transport system substrate-binding protein